MNTPVPGSVDSAPTPRDAAASSSRGESMRSMVSAARLVSFSLVCALLYWGRIVTIPVALAILLSFVLNPLAKRMQRAGLPRGAAVTITMVIVAGILVTLTTVIGSQLASLSHDLPKHKESIVAKIKEVRSFMRGGAVEKIQDTMETMASELGKDSEPDKSESGASEKPVAPEKEERAIPVYLTTPRKLVEFEGLSSMQPVVDLLTTTGLVLLLVIMMLLRWEDMRSRLISFTGHRNIIVATKACDDAGHRITRYLMMQLIVNGSYGIAIGIGLFFIGVPYAALWGLCAALFRYVPYAGPMVGALLPLTFSFITAPDWQQPLWVGGFIIGLELISNNVIEPWLYGANLGLSAMGIIIAAVAWTFLWGPVGLVLSTPLTVVLVVMGEYVPAFSIFSRLLGDKPVMEPHFQLYQRLLAGDEVEATELARRFLKENDLREAIDRLFIPALALAQRDDAADLLSKEDIVFVRKTMEGIFETFRAEAEEQEKEKTATEGTVPPQPLQPAPVVIWPVSELAATAGKLFEWVLRNATVEVVLIPPQSLLGEVVQEIHTRHPAAVCVMNLSGSLVPRTRQFVRRLRADDGGLPLVVARLGTAGTLAADVRDIFREAGATAVTRTLQETATAVLPYAIDAARSLPA